MKLSTKLRIFYKTIGKRQKTDGSSGETSERTERTLDGFLIYLIMYIAMSTVGSAIVIGLQMMIYKQNLLIKFPKYVLYGIGEIFTVSLMVRLTLKMKKIFDKYIKMSKHAIGEHYQNMSTREKLAEQKKFI